MTRRADGRLHREPPGELAAEVERLVALGARPVECGFHELGDESWQVMRDPEGNVLCVCRH